MQYSIMLCPMSNDRLQKAEKCWYFLCVCVQFMLVGHLSK